MCASQVLRGRVGRRSSAGFFCSSNVAHLFVVTVPASHILFLQVVEIGAGAFVPIVPPLACSDWLGDVRRRPLRDADWSVPLLLPNKELAQLFCRESLKRQRGSVHVSSFWLVTNTRSHLNVWNGVQSLHQYLCNFCRVHVKVKQLEWIIYVYFLTPHTVPKCLHFWDMPQPMRRGYFLVVFSWKLCPTHQLFPRVNPHKYNFTLLRLKWCRLRAASQWLTHTYAYSIYCQ